MTTRIGLIARADRTGLAVQTHAFWRNMNPHRTLVVDLSYCSGKKPDLSMYPDGELWSTTTYPHVYSQPDEQIDAFLDEVDVVFTCETPYNYWLFERAREKGVRTVLQYNYEFLEYLVAPDLPKPDLFAAPSTWYMDVVERRGFGPVVHLPVPVEVREDQIVRTELNQILHTLGNPAMEDRNGTFILLEAMQHVKSDVRVRVRSQRRFQKPKWFERDPRIKFDYRGTVDPWSQYSPDDDLYVMPRRFGGLCLPVGEALSLGMPVLMSKCPPNDSWLPQDWLVPGKWGRKIQTRARIPLYHTNPVRLAAKIDELHDNPDLVEEGSYWALDWASTHSWAALGDQYESALQGT